MSKTRHWVFALTWLFAFASVHSFASEIVFNNTLEAGGRVEWHVNPLATGNDSARFIGKEGQNTEIVKNVSLAGISDTERSREAVDQLLKQVQNRPAVGVSVFGPGSGAIGYTISGDTNQYVIFSDGRQCSFKSGGWNSWNVFTDQIEGKTYGLISIDTKDEVKGTYLVNWNKQVLKLSDQVETNLQNLASKKFIHNNTVVYPNATFAVKLDGFTTIERNAFPVFKHNAETFVFENDTKSGTLITRVRDRKSLRIRRDSKLDVTSIVGKIAIKDGILSVPTLYRKFDLDRFDFEFNFPIAEYADPVLDHENSRIDASKEVSENYQDLVLTSRTLSESIVGVEVPEILGKLSRTILSRRSAVLLGEPGTGKSTAIRAFAKEVALGKVPGLPRTLRIYEVNPSHLASGTTRIGVVERRVANLISASQDEGGIVYFLDELHSFSGVGTHSEKSTDILQSLKKHMEGRELILLATDTEHEFKASFEADPAFSQRFEPIAVNPPPHETLVQILKEKAQKDYGHTLGNDLAQEVLKWSSEYALVIAQPRAGVRLLEKAFTLSRDQDLKVQPITQSHVRKAVQELYGVGPEVFDEKLRTQQILALNEGMKERILGQKEAIHAMSSIWKRKVTRMVPIGEINSVLFVGPPGVGKTLTAESSADFMKYQKTVIHMGNFRNSYNAVTQFTQAIYRALLKSPLHVIVLDEFDKAALEVQNAALPILQSGIFTVDVGRNGHTLNREVNAKHAIFALTANSIQEITSPILSRIKRVIHLRAPNLEEFQKAISYYLKKGISWTESEHKNMKIKVINEDKFVQDTSSFHSIEASFRKAENVVSEKLFDSISEAILTRPTPDCIELELNWDGDSFTWKWLQSGSCEV